MTNTKRRPGIHITAEHDNWGRIDQVDGDGHEVLRIDFDTVQWAHLIRLAQEGELGVDKLLARTDTIVLDAEYDLPADQRPERPTPDFLRDIRAGQ